MNFKCLYCGRTQSTDANKHVSCLDCNKEMARVIENYSGLFMSPEFVIRRMSGIAQKHGIEQAHSSGRFKQEREGWTSAIWALGLSSINHRSHWVEIVDPTQQTPDTKVHYIDQQSNRNELWTFNLEIVDWEQHVDDALEVIANKCRKAYPPFYVLLVMTRSGKMVEPARIASAIRELKVPFREIWLVGITGQTRINSEIVNADCKVARVYPDFAKIEFDLATTVQGSKPVADVMMKLRRGTGTDFIPMGLIYFPLP